MKGRSHAALVLAIIAATLLGLYGMDETAQSRFGRYLGWHHSNGGQDLGLAWGIKLYKEPEPEPVHPLRATYPELFATDAVVVAFGADWCPWCKAQARELKLPSVSYNILYVKVEEGGETGAAETSRWGELMDTLNLGSSIPVTVVFSKGEVVKVFYGFTKWDDIKPFAEKAKKNDKDDEEGHIRIGPLNIDWDDSGVDIDLQRHGRTRRRY